MEGSVSPVNRSGAINISAQHAGAWLRALPNPNLGLAMPSRKSIKALRVWLGVGIFPPSPNSDLCLCGSSLDEFGDHLLGCDQKTNLVIERHDVLCDTLFHTLLVDDSRCRREQRCTTTSNSRPGDIFHPNFQCGLPTYFDLSVRNYLQPSYIIQAANRAEAAAEAGVLEKDCRHEDVVKATESIFEPVVVETLGLWHPHSMHLLKIIARKMAFHCCQTVSRMLMFLYEQLSVKLWLLMSN